MAGYVAGWNMPGYLPECDPERFESAGEAFKYLVETVDRFWDSDASVWDGDGPDPDGVWLPVHTELHNAPGTPWHGLSGDGRLVFWVSEDA